MVELGLDARGVAVKEGWEVDSALLRSILRRLRGICTHPQVRNDRFTLCLMFDNCEQPQVGQLPKQGEGLRKQGGLKTMNDVLEVTFPFSLQTQL